MSIEIEIFVCGAISGFVIAGIAIDLLYRRGLRRDERQPEDMT